ncbi:bifunctional demethylmenaquinone methyltransferase/2-methoxy-6-polyprenyl-1,4-benzoquinol methylase UbiE [soil metagenome]
MRSRTSNQESIEEAPIPESADRRNAGPPDISGGSRSSSGESGEERARLVREMFDRIAGRYELLNAIMTGGLNRVWNRKVISEAGVVSGSRVLDLACGTGSLTRDLASRVGPEGHVVGVDFSGEMLAAARRRPRGNIEYHVGDATSLGAVPGVESGAFDAATIAYGARNIPDLDSLFSEMSRAVRPGGRVVCLEIARPRRRLPELFYGLWFDKIVPWLGAKVSGDAWAYSYLPASVKAFVAPEDLAAIMKNNELRNVRWQTLAGGIITLHSGTRGEHDGSGRA